MIKLRQRILLIIAFIFIQSSLFSQEIDSIRSVKLIFEPIQEVLEENIGNSQTDGILGALPQDIDIKVKLEIELSDTTNLSKIFINLGTEANSSNLLHTVINFPNAIIIKDEHVLLYESILIIELGTFPKPAFISCDVWLENISGIQSAKVTYQTH